MEIRIVVTLGEEAGSDWNEELPWHWGCDLCAGYSCLISENSACTLMICILLSTCIKIRGKKKDYKTKMSFC